METLGKLLGRLVCVAAFKAGLTRFYINGGVVVSPPQDREGTDVPPAGTRLLLLNYDESVGRCMTWNGEEVEVPIEHLVPII